MDCSCSVHWTVSSMLSLNVFLQYSYLLFPHTHMYNSVYVGKLYHNLYSFFSSMFLSFSILDVMLPSHLFSANWTCKTTTRNQFIFKRLEHWARLLVAEVEIANEYFYLITLGSIYCWSVCCISSIWYSSLKVFNKRTRKPYIRINLHSLNPFIKILLKLERKTHTKTITYISLYN